MAKELCRTVYKRTILVVAVAAFSLLTTACKINKDANCLNPKASCYKKDTEAPKVESTTPASQPTVASPTPVATLNTMIINFSEPMKNADVKASYPNPVGGTNTLTVTSVTKLNDQSYQLNFSGNVGTGSSLQFDLSLLTDLAGNTVSPAQFTVLTSSIGAVPDTVTSSGGYTETNITWTNTTPDAMTYVIKVNGTSCADATPITGTNVSGTVLTNGQVITNAGFAQFPSATNTLRVCLTPVSSGTATEFTVTVNRDDTAPTITAPTSGRVKIPYAITLTCTDNVDRIIYTIDGSAPSFAVTATGGNIGATASINSFAYSIANGYSLTTRGAVAFKYLCIDKAGHTNIGGVQTGNLQSQFVWDESNWAPVAPNDVWD